MKARQRAARRSNHRADLALGLGVAIAIAVRRRTAAVIGIASTLAGAAFARACPPADQRRGCFALDPLTFDHVGHTPGRGDAVRVATFGALLLAVAGARAARACPPPDEAPTCVELRVEPYDHLGQRLTLTHVAWVRAAGAPAGDVTIDAAAGLGLTYGATLGGHGHDGYQLAASVGAAAHHVAGAIDASGASTHAELRLGPARVADGDPANARVNLVTFPLTFELAHDGELAALPRLGARPDVVRAAYGWQRVDLATRLGRSEREAADAHDPDRGASVTVDAVALHATLDATAQGDAARTEATLAGALGAVTVSGAWPTRHLEVLGFEYRDLRLPGARRAVIAIAWLGQLDVVGAHTGDRYGAAWGLVATMPGIDALADALAVRDHELHVGRLGWWHEWAGGGFGAQYQRAPYVTMAAQPALEDRWSIEAYRAGPVDVRAQAFVARTRRALADAAALDTSGGLAVELHRRAGDLDVTLATEVGRSYYGALDGAAPTLGLAGRATLTIQHAGSHAWTW